jgi:phage I-like protein
MLDKIASALGAATPDEGAILAEIDRRDREQSAQKTALSTAQARVLELETKLNAEGIAKLLESAYADGKIIPKRDDAGAITEGALEAFIRTMPLEAARDYVGRMTSYAPVGKPLQSAGADPNKPKRAGAVVITPSRAKRMKGLGLTAEDYEKHLDEETAV